MFPRKLIVCSLLLVAGIAFLLIANRYSLLVHAQTVDCQGDQDCINLQNQIDALNKAKSDSEKATTPLQGQLTSMKTQLVQIKANLANLSNSINQKQQDLSIREDKLAKEQATLEESVKSYYIRSFLTSPLVVLFSNQDSAKIFRELTYNSAATNQDQKIIKTVTQEVTQLLADKDKLEKNKANLASFQAQVNTQAASLDKVITQAVAYQATLTTQIATLSQQQESLIAARTGNFNVSVGSAALADDYNASLDGWSANAPGGSVTVFSFGAYAGNGANYQRNGMSQYGALARAKAGQDSTAILQAYYNQAPIHRDMPATINTDQGTMDFEGHYLYGIAEMPSSWTDNGGAALKAQAIAARTYAYHSTQGGGSICTSDSCQVYQSSKAANPPQAWKDAVDSTKGMILPDGTSAQYVSTPGGYLDTKGWDTTCGSQSCLASSSWDAASPWFYKAWYTNYRYGSGFSTCNKTNPWLSQTDLADILNAWVVYNNGSGDDKSHILPPDNCGGGSPYSISQMTDRANAAGGSYSSVSSVSVSESNSGYTSQVTFQTNRGSVTMPGFDPGCSHPGGGCKDFWTIFALRAPGNISIKSRLFDIRVK
jgi:peptidoglycan hydrolase CwlO-like protein